ncbi:tRNA (adenosine(37)-N6)-threonylcarbamoyltransferase complex ATPase subunit type 1 TsaE [uncultured Acidaminococcus sp.]|jgi:tRNA threonylcarbamoyladenosine biosynthesis protein TsaE|uniref:tRNA (adenosine(37)-N6)-threonylcarbamoyltransferase complex ATPase subunit type 1 TsaE n=1 Tax=uncultured Acidaminococcus sp. TaxID=352152 RepID=UPI0025FB9605|nr:tRNA (adenosine(37)-N6)-threonylcarbamoyltransferase complex ATPase subunit type 1 TsaE [uncultured Acidaminococcus sp.]
MIIACPTLKETKKLGCALGTVLGDGDVVLLDGDLGAGKTTLVTEIAETMGVDRRDVSSPTFSLMNIYRGKKLTLQHFDLYRLTSHEELDDIGFYEYVGTSGVTFVEWAELFPDEMPEDHLSIILRQEGTGRVAELVPQGAHYEALVRKVEELC